MTQDSTPRREFLGQIAASAIVLAGTACAAPVASQAASSSPTPAGRPSSGSGQWDDSWLTRLTAKHKAVFDSPQIEDGMVLRNASNYISGMREAAGAGDHDVQAVVVVRHAAIPMAFNDAMWQKYEIGKDKKVKAPGSEDWATRNLWLSGGGGRGGATAESSNDPQGNFAWLASHGHILLACDFATRNYAGVIARNFKLQRNDVYAELRSNLVPGFILQPTGVYAACRAQEAGCVYLRST
jgi:hypothetical protein